MRKSKEFRWYKANRNVYEEADRFLTSIGFTYEEDSVLDGARVYHRKWLGADMIVRFKWIEEPIYQYKGAPTCTIERIFEVYRNGSTLYGRRYLAHIIAKELKVKI